MTQPRFAALIALTSSLRFVAQGLFLPALPERLLAPRRRHAVLVGALFAAALECVGAPLLASGVDGVFWLALFAFPAGLAEPLLRAELMLEVPPRDAAPVKGALAVLGLLVARGAGPFFYGELFGLAPGYPRLVFFGAGACFVAAALAANATAKFPRNDGSVQRELAKILDVFGGGSDRRGSGRDDARARSRSPNGSKLTARGRASFKNV